jgi:uncharacterized protein (DUF433 family)
MARDFPRAANRRASLVRTQVKHCALEMYGYPPGMKYTEFFERRADLCGGQTVIRGTRVPVRTLLASLAEGGTLEEILADFPTVSPQALRAVVAFAAASAEEDMPLPALPAVA